MQDWLRKYMQDWLTIDNVTEYINNIVYYFSNVGSKGLDMKRCQGIPKNLWKNLHPWFEYSVYFDKNIQYVNVVIAFDQNLWSWYIFFEIFDQEIHCVKLFENCSLSKSRGSWRSCETSRTFDCDWPLIVQKWTL